MTSSTAEPGKSPHRQLLGMVVLVFLLQLGLIFWLGEHKVRAARPVETGMRIKLAPDPESRIAGLIDPTLFALPHREGFSGPAWMNFASVNYGVPDWTGPTNLLNVEVDQLGKSLGDYVRSNFSDIFDMVSRPAPRFDEVPLFRAIEGKSQLMFEGKLADRALLSRSEIKPWPAVNILADTEIQVAVKPEGTVFSAVLVSRSGLKEADDHALSVAKSLRFEPIGSNPDAKHHNSGDSMMWGRVVFEWFTIASAVTNATVANP